MALMNSIGTPRSGGWNPEAFFGFAQYATGMVPGAGSSFFNSLFGRGG